MKRSDRRIQRPAGSSRREAARRAPGANPNNPPLPLLKPWSWSLAGHALALAFMLISFAGRIQPAAPNFGAIAIDGVVLDDEAVKQEIQRLDDLERAAVIEREQEVERLRRQIQEQEARSRRQQDEISSLSSRAEEARRALDQEQARATRQLTAMQRRQQDEQDRLERIERERQAAAEEARQLAEKAEAAQRQLEETERKRREAEMAEQLRRELEAEAEAERIRRINESGLRGQYAASIRAQIENNWLKPADTREDLKWVVLLDILPGNEVAGIKFEEFNGTETDRRSIERAIWGSSPLPAPPAPEIFERQLRLRYPPSEPGA